MQNQGRNHGRVGSKEADNFRVKWGAKKRKTGSNGSKETLNRSMLSEKSLKGRDSAPFNPGACGSPPRCRRDPQQSPPLYRRFEF